MRRTLATLVLTTCALTHAAGQTTPIGPFTGDRSDPLNYPGTTIVARFPLFEHTGALRSHDGRTAIHYLLNDTFLNDVVTPRTGTHILGFTQGPGVFEFDPPVRRFGAYFNNNSGADDATVVFRDAGGAIIDTEIATVPFRGNVWVWNGWQSTTPIASATVTGNGVINGFLWFEDLEISYVPEPAGLGGLLLLALLIRRR